MADSIQDIKAMAQGLKDDIATLTTAVNEEQAQVADAIAKLEQIIADGGSEAERQEVLDILTSSKSDLSAAIADIKSTIPDEGTEESTEEPE